MKQSFLKLMPFAIFISLALFLYKGLSLNPKALPSVVVGKKIPEFSLPNLDVGQENLTQSVLPHHMFLLNVWASWCEACVEEQVFLMKLSQENIPIYGINYKDEPQAANRWLKEWGNPYQVCGMDQDGRFAMDLGVYGSPETFLIDERGIILHRHTGILNQAIWDSDFKPLMQNRGRLS
mgnify:CR=1 FL=1|tara:strand:- start:1211 stop:1747 length:537 start_codon:yes stop_codon:yes gene_type:complete